MLTTTTTIFLILVWLSVGPITIAHKEIALQHLIERLIPLHKGQIKIHIQNKNEIVDDMYEFSNVNGTIYLNATTMSSASRGLYDYLRKYYNIHVSWSGNQLSTIPSSNFEPLKAPLSNKAHKKFRYYLNPCTFSYSFTFWNKTRWEQEIDWMALNGINIALAFTGIEAIWIEVYKKLGLTDLEIQHYLAGPAYLAWNRMGNLHSLGGPIPLQWYTQTQYNLQLYILEQMRSLGITPVLPGFAGHVPLQAFKRLFPNVQIDTLSRWGHLNDTYCCVGFLNATTSLYKMINNVYMQTLTQHYGTNHIYSIDPFNELIPAFITAADAGIIAKSIYESLLHNDQNAIWLLQSWMFYDVKIWKPKYVESFLTAIPKGKFLVLDLAGDMEPLYELTNSFYGQPFIWCVLHNFGGTSGMQGNMAAIKKGLFQAYANLSDGSPSTCVGSGISMEGINQNSIIYEFVNDLAWIHVETDIKLEDWVDNYQLRRYGIDSSGISQAWRYLLQTVYSYPNFNERFKSHIFPGHGDYIITSMPSLMLDRTVPYNITLFEIACNLFLNVMVKSPKLLELETFKYDLVDLVRNAYQVFFEDIYVDLLYTYNANFAPKLGIILEQMNRAFSNMDDVLRLSNIGLQSWLREANQSAASVGTGEQFEIAAERFKLNALMQITTWAPHPSVSLLDYGKKQWNGMFACYYQPRWQLFIEHVNASIGTGKPFNQTHFESIVWQKVHLQFLYNATYLEQCIAEAQTGTFPSLITMLKRDTSESKRIDDIPNVVEKQY